MVKRVKKVEKVNPPSPNASAFGQTKSADKENPGSPGIYWWILLGVVVGFAVLSLLGAAVLVVLLGVG